MNNKPTYAEMSKVSPADLMEIEDAVKKITKSAEKQYNLVELVLSRIVIQEVRR